MNEQTTIRKNEINTDFEVRSLDKIYTEEQPKKKKCAILF